MRKIIFVLAFVVAASAAAQVHKCEGEDGVPVFQNLPCADDLPAVKDSRAELTFRPGDQPAEISGDQDLYARILCGKAVERAARHGFRWIAGDAGVRFLTPQPSADGQLLYQGDRIEMQDGRGNWFRHIYGCLYDPQTHETTIGVSRGKLR